MDKPIALPLAHACRVINNTILTYNFNSCAAVFIKAIVMTSNTQNTSFNTVSLLWMWLVHVHGSQDGRCHNVIRVQDYYPDEDSSTAVKTVGKNNIIYYSLSISWFNKSVELAMIDCPVKNPNKLSTTRNLNDRAMHGRSQKGSRLPQEPFFSHLPGSHTLGLWWHCGIYHHDYCRHEEATPIAD